LIALLPKNTLCLTAPAGRSAAYVGQAKKLHPVGVVLAQGRSAMRDKIDTSAELLTHLEQLLKRSRELHDEHAAVVVQAAQLIAAIDNCLNGRREGAVLPAPSDLGDDSANVLH
jgi:hypothetical protein